MLTDILLETFLLNNEDKEKKKTNSIFEPGTSTPLHIALFYTEKNKISFVPEHMLLTFFSLKSVNY